MEPARARLSNNSKEVQDNEEAGANVSYMRCKFLHGEVQRHVPVVSNVYRRKARARREIVMDLHEAKEIISRRFGVPVELLTATSTEDAIVQAAALKAYKAEKEPKTTAEQFGAWLNGQTALDRGDIVDVEAVRAEIDPPYPGVRDGGEPYAPQTNYYGDAREQFAQWFGSL